MPPLISVTMPAYNTAPWIGEAVQSMLEQTHRDWELLVIDDGSTDGTVAAAKAAAGGDPRVRFFSIPHGGWPEARNLAFRESRGKLIARLDSDDSQDRTRLEKQVALLMERPSLDCVTTGARVFYEGKPDRDRLRPTWKMVPDLFMRGKAGNAPCNGSIVTHREFNAQVGPFGGEYLCGEDTDWNRRASLLGARWANIDEPLYYHRRRKGQLTGVTEQHKRVNPQRPCDWKKLGRAWKSSRYRCLEILALTRCNLGCPHCSQGRWRGAFPDFQLSLEQVRRIVQRAVELELHVAVFDISGGEPLLWPHLAAAAELVKAAGIADMVRVRTNGILLTPELLDGTPAIDRFRISAYSGKSRGTENDRVSRDRVRHKPMPTAPVKGCLPADCNCAKLCVIGDRVYPCGNGVTLALAAGISVDDPAISCSLDDDWLRHFRRLDCRRLPICEWCLANHKIWKRTPYAT